MKIYLKNVQFKQFSRRGVSDSAESDSAVSLARQGHRERLRGIIDTAEAIQDLWFLSTFDADKKCPLAV